MGGDARAHETDYHDEEDVGPYKLNLTETQLDQVAKKLRMLEPAEKAKLGGGHVAPPANGGVMVTYKGRYVRIRYKNGQIEEITPED